jgi:hypothetical protein
MEQVRLRVKSVEVIPGEGLAVARVSATSTRKVSGSPAARIVLQLTFEADANEDARAIRQLARDAALAYLDVA